MEQFTVQLNNAPCTVCIGAGVLGRAGALLRQYVPQVRRWALAADEAVSAFYGEWVQGSLRAAGLESRLFLLPQGESAKTPEAWLSLCRRILDSGFDRSCGVVTLGGGACGDYIGQAIALGCDTFVTSDLKYNDFLDTEGLNLIDAGHFPTENVVCPVLRDRLAEAFPAVDVLCSTSHSREIIQYCIKEK